MSVRAYRIIEIKRKDSPSFNLWHNGKLMDFVEGEEGYNASQFNGDSGNIELSVELLEKVVAKAKELELDEDVVAQLKEDIAACKEDGYVIYDCF